MIKPKLIPLLLVEDNLRRVQWFENQLPIGYRIILARSGGTALGMLERDHGRVYGGILLDHDLQKRTVLDSDQKVSGSHLVGAIIAHISSGVPILIHSMNPDKSPLMARKLETAGFWVTKKRWFDINEEVYWDWLEDVSEEWDDYWST